MNRSQPGSTRRSSIIHNQEVVANLFQEPAAAVPGEAGDRGLLLDRTLTMVEVADLLNMLRYPAGSDGSVDPDAARHWAAVQAVAELGADDPLFPIYDMPADTEPAVWGTNDPFNVAAYLRFWALCLERRCPAVFSTDEPPQRWSTIDLQFSSARRAGVPGWAALRLRGPCPERAAQRDSSDGAWHAARCAGLPAEGDLGFSNLA